MKQQKKETKKGLVEKYLEVSIKILKKESKVTLMPNTFEYDFLKRQYMKSNIATIKRMTAAYVRRLAVDEIESI